MKTSACLPALVALLAGCASPDPRLYTLDMRPGPPVPSAARVVVVRSVRLSKYLQREELLRRIGPGRLMARDNDWWAEPLAVMIRRVLVADLAQRLPGKQAVTDEDKLTGHPDEEVALDIDAFEPTGTETLLVGLAAIVSSNGVRWLNRISVNVPLGNGTAQAQVDSMSAALGLAADAILHEPRT